MDCILTKKDWAKQKVEKWGALPGARWWLWCLNASFHFSTLHLHPQQRIYSQCGLPNSRLDLFRLPFLHQCWSIVLKRVGVVLIKFVSVTRVLKNYPLIIPFLFLKSGRNVFATFNVPVTFCFMTASQYGESWFSRRPRQGKPAVLITAHKPRINNLILLFLIIDFKKHKSCRNYFWKKWYSFPSPHPKSKSEKLEFLSTKKKKLNACG